jgi:hypothetical protein
MQRLGRSPAARAELEHERGPRAGVEAVLDGGDVDDAEIQAGGQRERTR